MSDFGYVTSVVASYWIVSISMVYLNKVLLSNEEASIPAPIFVTWYRHFLSLCTKYSRTIYHFQGFSALLHVSFALS